MAQNDASSTNPKPTGKSRDELRREAAKRREEAYGSFKGFLDRTGLWAQIEAGTGPIRKYGGVLTRIQAKNIEAGLKNRRSQPTVIAALRTWLLEQPPYLRLEAVSLLDELIETIDQDIKDIEDSDEPALSDSKSSETLVSNGLKHLVPGQRPTLRHLEGRAFMPRKTPHDDGRELLDVQIANWVTALDLGELGEDEEVSVCWIGGAPGYGKSVALLQTFGLLRQSKGDDKVFYGTTLESAVKALKPKRRTDPSGRVIEERTSIRYVFVDDAYSLSRRKDVTVWRTLHFALQQAEALLVTTGPPEHRNAFGELRDLGWFSVHDFTVPALSDAERADFGAWFVGRDWYKQAQKEAVTEGLPAPELGRLLRHGNFCVVAWDAERRMRSTETLEEFGTRLRTSYKDNPFWNRFMQTLAAARLGVELPASIILHGGREAQVLLSETLLKGTGDEPDENSMTFRVHPALAAELHRVLREIDDTNPGLDALASDLASAYALIGSDESGAELLLRSVFWRDKVTERLDIGGESRSRFMRLFFDRLIHVLWENRADLPAHSLYRVVSMLGGKDAKGDVKPLLKDFDWKRWLDNPPNPEWEGSVLNLVLKFFRTPEGDARAMKRALTWVSVETDDRTEFPCFPWILAQLLERFQKRQLTKDLLDTLLPLARSWCLGHVEARSAYAGNEQRPKTNRVITVLLTYFVAMPEAKLWACEIIQAVFERTSPGQFELEVLKSAHRADYDPDELVHIAFRRLGQFESRYWIEFTICWFFDRPERAYRVTDDDWKTVEGSGKWPMVWQAFSRAAKNKADSEGEQADPRPFLHSLLGYVPEEDGDRFVSPWAASVRRWPDLKNEEGVANWDSTRMPYVELHLAYVGNWLGDQKMQTRRVDTVMAWLSDPEHPDHWTSPQAGIAVEALLMAASQVNANAAQGALTMGTVWMRDSKARARTNAWQLGIVLSRAVELELRLERKRQPTKIASALEEYLNRADFAYQGGSLIAYTLDTIDDPAIRATWIKRARHWSALADARLSSKERQPSKGQRQSIERGLRQLESWVT